MELKTKLEKSDFNTENMPINVQAEQAVIAAILVNNLAWEKVSDFLKPEHFSHPAHKFLFEVIEKQLSKGMPADPITIKNYISQAGVLDDVGGIGYLTELAKIGTSVINVLEYGKLIYDTAVRRQLIEVGRQIVETASTEQIDLSATGQIEIAEKKLFDLAQTGEVERGPMDFTNALKMSLQNIETAYKSDGKLSGLTTGFTDLDKRVGGFHKSDLIVLAGRPAMGKTALAVNIAFNAANEIYMGRVPKDLSGAVLFFSLEMSTDQLASRILSNICELNGNDLRNGNISDTDFLTLTERSRALSKLPLYIDDTPGMSVPRIRSRARRIARQHNGLSLIVIDYLQLLTSPGGQKQENRVQELSEMTRGLKILAKELNVPVVALSQLSRSVESRPLNERRPVLSDLRESGSIEQDADIVMFTYRHEYYLQQQKKGEVLKRGETPEMAAMDLQKWKNKAELIISKQRHGPVGTVPLLFFGEYTRFADELPGDYSSENIVSASTGQKSDVNITDDDIKF